MGERLPTISDMAATVALKQASALSHPALRSCRRWLVELTAISALRRRPSSSFMARKVAFTSFFPGCSGIGPILLRCSLENSIQASRSVRPACWYLCGGALRLRPVAADHNLSPTIRLKSSTSSSSSASSMSMLRQCCTRQSRLRFKRFQCGTNTHPGIGISHGTTARLTRSCH